jgi:hypothetical protein
MHKARFRGESAHSGRWHHRLHLGLDERDVQREGEDDAMWSRPRGAVGGPTQPERARYAM